MTPAAARGLLDLPWPQDFALPDVEGTDKRMALDEALRRFVTPGSTVHIGYSDARPNAAMLQLVRQFAGTRPGLTLSSAGLASVQHALLEAGVVDRLIVSFAGENYPSARPNKAMQRAVREHRVTVENWSLWALIARLVAGALGVPYLPIRSLAGSGMAAEHLGTRYVEVPDPFGSDTSTGLVAALRPDIVLLHGVAADRAGNVVMAAPYGEGAWGALAARNGVVATVERIVDTAELRESGALVRIPGHLVRAVCEVPYGSHPYGLYNPGFPGVDGYAQDGPFIDEVLRASSEPESFSKWIADWVVGPGDHSGYLAKLGDGRLAELVKLGCPDAWHSTYAAADAGDTTTWSDSELMVIAAARMIADRVTSCGHDAVLAGVGQSNLAAWLAVTSLKHSGIDVELMAEIGMFGYVPRPGEPFIFANRNLPTCKLLTDVMTVLGAFVSGPGTRALGVIGTAALDANWNANSTYGPDGDFLVGSGGANDIASAADEVLVTISHTRERLVNEVRYVTCPGEKVKTVVTSAGVFERHDGRVVLTRMLPGVAADLRAGVERIRTGCAWDFDVASSLVVEKEPSMEELSTLRAFDPERLFLRGRAVNGGAG